MRKSSPARLRRLQRKCTRALRLHADLAAAACEMLFKAKNLSPAERSILKKFTREEFAALTAYQQAKTQLAHALSLEPVMADGRKCDVLSVNT